VIKIRTYIYICLGIILAAFMFYYIGNKSFLRKKTTSIVQALPKESNVALEAQNVSLTEIAPKSFRGWHILSKTALFIKSQNEIICKGVIFNLITKNNQVANLNSENLVVNSKTKDIFLKGAINGSFDDIELLGEDFYYKFDKHVISSKSKMQLKHPSFNLTSQNTSIDVKNKKIVLSGRVESVFNMPGKQQ